MAPLPDQALRRFRVLLNRACRSSLGQPTAMVLATADAHGRPSARVVLLKEASPRGFVFYTNLKSPKGRQIAQNPRGALCFYWDSFSEQVRVEGRLEPVSDSQADAYWLTRPRESQVGAWASLQSERLNDRKTLLARFSKFQAKFEGSPVPRPPHWGGYCLLPDRMEFWRSRAHRLHERIVYQRRGRRWAKGLLYP